MNCDTKGDIHHKRREKWLWHLRPSALTKRVALKTRTKQNMQSKEDIVYFILEFYLTD